MPEWRKECANKLWLPLTEATPAAGDAIAKRSNQQNAQAQMRAQRTAAGEIRMGRAGRDGQARGIRMAVANIDRRHTNWGRRLLVLFDRSFGPEEPAMIAFALMLMALVVALGRIAGVTAALVGFRAIVLVAATFAGLYCCRRFRTTPYR